MTTENKVTEYGMMFLNVVTPLHNGSGEGLGIIDNPILRERTTQFPLIQASSIKGVLRDAYEELCVNGKIEKDYLLSLFGPSPKSGHEHSGAISFGDGEILAFPVRSVNGCFVWVTCPHVIWRFYSKVNLVKLGDLFPSIEKIIGKMELPLASAKICPAGKDEICMEKGQKIYLEEHSLKCSQCDELEAVAKQISSAVFPEQVDSFLKEQFEKKLVLLDDKTFRYFTSNATEVIPNISIGKNGTTKKGSLRYTEYLPAETILYNLLFFAKSRRQNPSLQNAIDVKQIFEAHIPTLPYVQIGGDETTGKGIVKLSLPKDIKIKIQNAEISSVNDNPIELESQNENNGSEESAT